VTKEIDRPGWLGLVTFVVGVGVLAVLVVVGVLIWLL
jgi:hypothetical protein